MVELATIGSQFFAASSSGDRVDMLRGSGRTVGQLLKQVSSFTMIPDQTRLLDSIDNLDRQVRSRPIRDVLNAARELISFDVRFDDAPVSLRYAPFSRIGAATSELEPIFVIKENGIRPDSLGSLISMIKRVPAPRRPKILFEYNETKSRGSSLLSKIADQVTLYERRGGKIEVVEFEPPVCSQAEFAHLILADSLSAQPSEIPSTDLACDEQEARRRFLHAHLYIKARKISASPRDIGPFYQKLLAETYKRLEALSDPDGFWTPALVHLLLEAAYVYESAPEHIYQALRLADAADPTQLKLHTLKYCNQHWGHTDKGVNSMEEAILKFETSVPSGNPYLPSYLGLIQNLTSTRLYRRRSELDSKWTEERIDFMLDEGGFYTNAGMLTSVSAIELLMLEQGKEALDRSNMALSLNADEVDYVNVLSNHLIIQRIVNGACDEALAERVFLRVKALNFGPSLWHQPIRILGNLLNLGLNESLNGEIRYYLLESRFSGYDNTMLLDGSVLRTAIPGVTFGRGDELTGAMKSFFDTHNLMPSCCFDWL
jgi:hypothetical protein